MPNSISAAGLTTATRDELIAFFTASWQAIYGADINLAQDTPDGQMMNIFVQSILDLQDLLTQIYNGFDPDNAIGVVLDQRVSINGIQRQAGTHSITNITVTVSQALNLFGLDQLIQAPFTVADNAGNNWVLQSSQSISVPGIYVFSFQALVPGAVLTIPNTITVPVTIVLGVTSVNNPTAATSTGLNEETDAALKIRRQQSVSLSSQGYLQGLLAALLNINGLTFAKVYENNTNATDGDGVPGHTIWVIVAGTYNNSEVANAIYTKRNAGCGLFGSIPYTITQVDGSSFIVVWDIVIPQPLFIKFTATSLDGVTPPNIAGIRSGLVTSFVPGVFEKVNVNDLATAVQNIDNNCLVTSDGFSLLATGPFTTTLVPNAKNKQFAVSSPNIIILPMIMSPASATVSVLGTKQFTGLGGFGAITYSMFANPTGGTVSPTGLYTAGPITGTDVVRATDTQANFVDATVTVI